MFALGVAVHLLVRLRKVDVVHLHGAAFLLRILGPLKRVCGFHLVYKPTMLGGDDAECVVRNQGKRTADDIDRWICISEELARSADRAGMNHSAIIRIANGVDTARFKPMDESNRVVMRAELGLSQTAVWMTVGAVEPRKRIHLLVDAWAQLAPVRPMLLVVGPNKPVELRGGTSSYPDEIRESIARFRLGHHIRFTGERSDVEKLFGAVDGFVFASQQEGMPNAVLEALACGLPVIATGNPAIEEIAARAPSAVTVVAPTAEAIADALRTVSARTPRQSQLPIEWSLASVAERYVAIYRDLRS